MTLPRKPTVPKKLTVNERKFALVNHLIERGWRPDVDSIQKISLKQNHAETSDIMALGFGRWGGNFYLVDQGKRYSALIRNRDVVFRIGHWSNGRSPVRLPLGTLELTRTGVKYGLIEIGLDTSESLGTIDLVEHYRREAEDASKEGPKDDTAGTSN